ncbi:MAG TPA: heat-inducible transcriptional repressor HrcA, partial [Candidatus Binataceae bacterium]|nr:heat-inducible transcriptional repressor HrcA [Candidatus Binataceae bacterium]
MDAEERDQSLAGKRRTLLIATVAEFIATAQPVGSQQVAGRHNIGIKSAMARNMMAELEELGYLSQPHTSAGRVPTDKAFRYFVDHMADSTRIAFRDRTQIELHYSERGRDLLALMRDTPRLLSLLTGQAAIVMSPRLETVEIERVNFVRLRESEVLAIFVTKASTVQNRVVACERDHLQDELDRMARYLNESLHGRTLDQARRWIESQLREERARYDSFMREALEFGDAVTGHIEGGELYVEGSVNALEQPEFADPERVKDLLRALEDKTALLQLLERSLEQHTLTVSIGSENVSPKLAAFSVVAAPYTGGAKPPGSVAIVGPVRMD